MIVKESDVILTRLESSQAQGISHFIFNFFAKLWKTPSRLQQRRLQSKLWAGYYWVIDSG
jgi:hypothetical protein